jgi:Minichromosome loss protein, Mcl1, middle region
MAPTDLLWQYNRLYVIDSRAKLWTCEKPELEWKSKDWHPHTLTATATSKKSVTFADAMNSLQQSAAAKQPSGTRDILDDDGDEDDSLFGKDASQNSSAYIDDEASEDDNANMNKTASTTNTNSGLNDDSDEGSDSILPLRRKINDEEIEDDDDVGNDDDAASIDDDRLQPSTRYDYNKVEPQPAFAPSSTPLDLDRRYLCWNHLGAITLLRGERSVVDIDFTDRAFRRPVTFTDTMGFILGSLGEEGAIFATDVTEDDGDDLEVEEYLGDVVSKLSATRAALKQSQRKLKNKKDGRSTGSSLYFHRFDTFAATRDKDWFLTLPDGERALGCACGKGWAAVVTR